MKIMTKKCGLCLVLAAAVALMSGCFALSSYRTAKTLEEGVAEIGIAYTATRIASGESTSTFENPLTGEDETVTEEAVSFFFPNGLAELYFAVGIMEDLEFISRIALHNGLAEIGVNYRLMGSDDSNMHLSIAPAIGGQFLLVFEGFTAKLPVLFTYEVADTMNITLGGFADFKSLGLTDDSFGGDGANSLSGDFLSLGVTALFRFEGETFYVGPLFEYSHVIASFGAGDDFEISSATNLLFVGLGAGWYLGREKKQLDRMENKIDKIDDKLGGDEGDDGDRYNFSWQNQVDEEENLSFLDPR